MFEEYNSSLSTFIDVSRSNARSKTVLIYFLILAPSYIVFFPVSFFVPFLFFSFSFLAGLKENAANEANARAARIVIRDPERITFQPCILLPGSRNSRHRHDALAPV